MRVIALSILGGLLASCLVGCGERRADLDNPKQHQSGALAFSYPGNWTVTTSKVINSIQLVIIESPGDSLVVLQTRPLGSAEELSDFAMSFSSDAISRTSILKTDLPSISKVSQTGAYELVTEEFTVTLLNEEIDNTRLYASRILGEQKIFLILQVADEYLNNAKPGFELVLESLRLVEDEVEDLDHLDPKAETE